MGAGAAGRSRHDSDDSHEPRRQQTVQFPVQLRWYCTLC